MWRSAVVVVVLAGCSDGRVDVHQEKLLELQRRVGDLEMRELPQWWCSRDRCERAKFDGAEARLTAWCAGERCVPTIEQCTGPCVGVR